ncbi:hypothetical protein LCGC14_0982610, partial [marine sediment metagenome]
IAGQVYGHKKHIDGHRITTSKIIEINGNMIKTNSGSIYKLEEPDPQYVEWCEKEGHYVPTNIEPIKLL